MARKGENIYKRKDGRWEGRYIKSHEPSGKAKYGYVYAKSYRDVKEKLIHAKQQNRLIHQSSQKEIGTETFEIVALSWLRSKDSQIKESTGNKYYNLLYSYIFPQIVELSICLITLDIIESMCLGLLSEGGQKKIGLSPKTVSDILSVIRNVLQYATRKGYTISYDIASIRLKQENREMRVLSRFEQDVLCKYIFTNPTLGNIGILISLFTGMRIGEVCALRWNNISFSEKTVHVYQTMQRVQTKNDPNKKTKIIITAPKSSCSIRIIPLPEFLVDFLESFQDTSMAFVLTGSTEKAMEPRCLHNHFKKALLNSSIENANFHALRHTFATRCIELGFDVKSLSEILGHASVNITMNRYVHPSMQLKQENMQRLSTLISIK